MSFQSLATKESLEIAVSALSQKGYSVSVVPNGQDALEKIKQTIPDGASVMNGSSVTLDKVGFIEYLKSHDHKWNNLHAAIVAEADPVKQKLLRKQALLSDYYVGSVHAVTQEGDLVFASNTGSQLPHIVYSSDNLIFVISTKKIVTDEAEGMKRLKEYVVPLEDTRLLSVYNVHTALNKLLVFKGESPMIGRKIHIIFVEEDLGF